MYILESSTSRIWGNTVFGLIFEVNLGIREVLDILQQILILIPLDT